MGSLILGGGDYRGPGRYTMSHITSAQDFLTFLGHDKLGLYKL